VTSAAIGLTAWYSGSLFYNTGYYAYVNPYYVPTTTVIQYPVLNYSQPIQTTAEPPDENGPVERSALAEGDQARDAFYRGDYAKSLSRVDAALAKTPGDAVLHEFRALTLFAMRRYKESAATLYAVLSVAPGWDWTTMIGLYPSEDVYEKQLQALETYVRTNPNVPEGHFVLAYQYMTAGHPDAAAEQFQRVVQLVPNDDVSKQMLTLLANADAQQPTTQPVPAATPNPADAGGPSIPRASLLGNWSAPSPADGSVDFSLGNDGRFNWKFTQAGKAQSFTGKYELAGNTLVLDYDNGGTMVAKLNAKGPDQFAFQMVGGPPSDPGLLFARATR
jgi:tetratricopeptide (TPR) repeat protein